jgi:PAS domain S-box-containing protein
MSLSNIEKNKKHASAPGKRGMASRNLYRDEEFRILVACVKEYAIFMIDLEGMILTWNEGAKHVKGYNADEIIGQRISVFYAEDDIKKGVVEQNLKMAKEQGSFEDKGWRLKKDGSMFWASVFYTVCYNKHHRLIGYTIVTRDISDQKKVEDKLVKLVFNQAGLMQSAYEKLVFHIENTPLGFIEWDEKFHIRSLSKRAEEIFGWGLQEFIENEMTGFTLAHEEDRSRLLKVAEKLLSGEIERNNIQNRNYTKDDKVIWCDWFNSVLKDKDGKVITVMSLVQDVTERKENEEKLKQSESRFKEAQKMAHVGNWELNFSTGILTWSQEARRIYGLPLDNNNESYQSWISMIHPADVAYVKRITAEAEATISNAAFFHRIVRRDGSIRHLYSKSQFQFNSDGKPVGLYGVAHDVTEMKEAEEALKQSEFRYRQIVETAQEGIWLVDESNRTTFANKKMGEILGYLPKEMLGKDLYYFTDSEGKEAGVKAMKRRKEGVAENLDFRFITKNGQPIWANINVNSIFTDEGNYNGALAMVSDITEKKILQQQLLQEQIDNLKGITKAVINAQEKERAEIGRELHDNVNQLLAASRLYLNHGLTQPDYETFILKGQEFISMAIEEIRKLSHALVGPNQGNAIGLIDSVDELIHNFGILKDVKIEFNHSGYHEEETEVGLKLVLYRIIQDQFNNILKHAEASEVEIELKQEAKSLMLIITDNGKGFNSAAKSDGIGLKNIRSRADVYNGIVEIFSSPGNGCKMKIVF